MPSLPPEVLDLVIDAVALEYRYHQRLQFLSHCSLVSRQFAKRAHHHMFAEVLITDYDWKIFEGAPVIERIHGLRDLLCAPQPPWDDLTSHLRSLTIRLNNNGECERAWLESEDRDRTEDDEGVGMGNEDEGGEGQSLLERILNALESGENVDEANAREGGGDEDNNDDDLEEESDEDDTSEEGDEGDLSSESDTGSTRSYHNDAVVLSDGSLAAIMDRLSSESQKRIPHAFSLTVVRLNELEWKTLDLNFRNSLERLVRSPSLYSLGLGGFVDLPLDFFLSSPVRSLELDRVYPEYTAEKNQRDRQGLSRMDTLSLSGWQLHEKFIPDTSLAGVKTLGCADLRGFCISQTMMMGLTSVTKLKLTVHRQLSMDRPFDFGSGKLPSLEILELETSTPFTCEFDHTIVDNLLVPLKTAKTVGNLKEIRMKFDVKGDCGAPYVALVIDPSREWVKLDDIFSSNELPNVKRVTIQLHYLHLQEDPIISVNRIKDLALRCAHTSFPSLINSKSKEFSIELYCAGYSAPWCIVVP